MKWKQMTRRLRTMGLLRGFAPALLILTIFLVGCSAYHSLPTDWSKQIPGRYEGAHGSLKEVMSFEVGGKYAHQILDGTNTVVEETGSWNVPAGRYEIVLTPTGSFTEFYDPLNRTFSTQSNPAIGYTFRPLPDGKKFSKISASTKFEFCLVRVTKSQAGDESTSGDSP
jgi:hypothetical protein